ncbi:hypothetical protein ACIRPK_36575 [Kitasatospora sp. NPDC101801]|uniref:hypothetical protein n=1 Tax=Kitasatospora sp. NPDC101801 TaxID=3364103 RepID=UPI0037F63AAE
MDVPGPVSTVDAQRAQQDGLARLRRRRRAAVVATGVAVAVAATLSLTLPGSGGKALGPTGTLSPSPVPSLSQSPSATRSPSAPPGSGTPAPDQSQTAAPHAGRAPLTVEADFGWLPASSTTIRYQLSPNGMTVRAEGALGADPMVPFFVLTAFPAGVTPPLTDFPGGSHPVKVPAPPVNGQEAYWVSSDDPGYASGLNILHWKSPDGRWLELNSSYVPAADKERVPLRIAADVKPGHRPVPLPLRVDGIPSGFVLSSAGFRQGTGQDKGTWTAELVHSAAPGLYFMTRVSPDAHHSQPGGPSTDPWGGGCKAADGVQVCVEFVTPGTLDAVGGVQGWLDKVTLLGTDPAKWTADVLN